MRQLTRVTLSMRDLDRLKCIQAVSDGQLQRTLAAERLGIATRQVRRIVDPYRLEGPILREISPDFGPQGVGALQPGDHDNRKRAGHHLSSISGDPSPGRTGGWHEIRREQ